MALTNNQPPHTLKKRRNASILESFLAFFILLLIMFGVLQVYRFILAGMVLEYAAFRGARSAAVGFADYLIQREIQVKTIPVSGAIVEPFRNGDESDSTLRYGLEKRSIERYMSGERYMQYEYWHGDPVLHSNYKCPDYGKIRNSGCAVCGKFQETNLTYSHRTAGSEVTIRTGFENYPFTMPLYEIFAKDGTLNLMRQAELTNHAGVFLD